jgi:hypothetical protein
MRYGKYMRIKGGKSDSFEHAITKRDFMDQEMEKLIWEYIDGRCDPAGKELVNRQLEEDPAWRIKLNELMNIHEILQKEELEMPSLRFTKTVMEEIARVHVAPATKNYINKNIIRGISAFFLAMIGGLLVYIIGQTHWNANSTSNLIPEYSLDANKLNWSKLLNNTYVNIFVGINIMLALILVDKYLRGKKKAGHSRHWTKGDSA